jgi:TctA family transporter
MDLKESEEFAMSLIILGIAISRDGDSKRITDWVEPEMFSTALAQQGMRALMGRSRHGVAAFLRAAGVEMAPGEMAVDAIIRTLIDIVESRASQHKVAAERARAKEMQLMTERSKLAGSPKEAVQ